jgi:hypothetical protein
MAGGETMTRSLMIVGRASHVGKYNRLAATVRDHLDMERIYGNI